MEGSKKKKKKKRENQKDGGGGSVAGHGTRAGPGTWQWMGTDGDGWGTDREGYPGGIGSSLLSSPLPHFSPVQKEGEKKIRSDLLGLPRES